MKKGLIITGGDRPAREILLREIHWADGIICADRGFDAVEDYREKIILVIGDFDSTHRKDAIERLDIPVEVLPPMKDETDTEMAFLRMLEHEPEEIHLLGGMGSRWDHSLATVLSLEAYLDRCEKITMIDGQNELQMVRPGTYSVKKENYHYFSVVPISDYVIFSTHGLKYEVSELKLLRKKTRGVSNEIVKDNASVTIHEGIALFIKSKDA